MNLTDQQLDSISTWAARNPIVVSIQLFGSRVKGTAGPNSDLDLALDIGDDEETLRTWIEHKKTWQQELGLLTGLLVDVQLYHPLHSRSVYSYVADCGYQAYRR